MSSSLLQPGNRFGDYELLRKIEAGGMGEVWKASQIHSEQLVAIKFIKPHLLDDPVHKSRFLQEAKTLARLEHDRIVPLYGVCEASGRLALILRFIDGESLARRIDRLGAVPPNLALACVRDILPALDFAHSKGIVHRDIKPQNILIDSRERFFLSDFGIAVTEFAGRATAEGTSLGTLHYMSPEQIENPRALDPHLGGHRSDIYSFGVVLFEMLTGRLPFGDRRDEHEGWTQIAWMHCTAPPPRLRDFHPALTPAIEGVVLQCLEKNADLRPQSCADLLKMLEDSAAAAPEAPNYVPTVVEKVAVKGNTTALATPRLGTVGRNRIEKAVWLGLGGLSIAAAVSYGVLTKDQSRKTPHATAANSPQITAHSVPPQPKANSVPDRSKTENAPRKPGVSKNPSDATTGDTSPIPGGEILFNPAPPGERSR
jgi:eukaryotic-like serine/threonine-protein kinase